MVDKTPHIEPTASIPKAVLLWFASHSATNELRVFVFLKYSWKSLESGSGLTKPVFTKEIAKELGICRQTVGTCLNRLKDKGFINDGGKKHPNCYFTRSWSTLFSYCIDRLKEDQQKACRKNRKKTFKLKLKDVYTFDKKKLTSLVKSSFIVENLNRQQYAIKVRSRKSNNKVGQSSTKGRDDQNFYLGGSTIADWFGKSSRTGRKYRKDAEKSGIIQIQQQFQLECVEPTHFRHMKKTGEYANLFERNGAYYSRKPSKIILKSGDPFDYGRSK